jgi:hypothetical protein
VKKPTSILQHKTGHCSFEDKVEVSSVRSFFTSLTGSKLGGFRASAMLSRPSFQSLAQLLSPKPPHSGSRRMRSQAEGRKLGGVKKSRSGASLWKQEETFEIFYISSLFRGLRSTTLHRRAFISPPSPKPERLPGVPPT